MRKGVKTMPPGRWLERLSADGWPQHFSSSALPTTPRRVAEWPRLRQPITRRLSGPVIGRRSGHPIRSGRSRRNSPPLENLRGERERETERAVLLTTTLRSVVSFRSVCVSVSVCIFNPPGGHYVVVGSIRLCVHTWVPLVCTCSWRRFELQPQQPSNSPALEDIASAAAASLSFSHSAKSPQSSKSGKTFRCACVVFSNRNPRRIRHCKILNRVWLCDCV